MTLPLTSGSAADGLPEAKAGTLTVAIAAHANHGKYFLLNPIPGLSPSDGPRSRPNTTSRMRRSQRLLRMREAKPLECSSDDGGRLDLDPGGRLDERRDLHDGHRGEVAAHHLAVGGADLLLAREILLARSHVPGQACDELGARAGLGQHRDDGAQGRGGPAPAALRRGLAVP